MSKKLFQTTEEKQGLIEGIKSAKNYVGSTMGAAGKTVIISHGIGTMPQVTKDGVTALRAMFPHDELENAGITLLKDAANETVKQAGDGTTMTTVIAASLIIEGSERIAKGAKPQFVKKGIDIAIKEVVKQIALLADPIGKDNNKILNVATISANNDAEIGKLIADAYKEIGNEGLLTVEKSSTSETYTKIVQGFEFPRGYIDPYYINVPEKRIAVLENPQILITDYTISSVKDLKDIAEVFDKVIESGRPIMIICTDTDQIAHATFLQNRAKGLEICVVKATNTYKTELLEDIATLTGGTVMCDKNGKKLYQLRMEHLGQCEKIIVTDKTTTIIGGKGEVISVIRRKEGIQTMIDTTEDIEVKNVCAKRLAQVSGSVGVIHVGAATYVEFKEKYDRTDDAVRAVKSAIEEGIVAGGGVTLLRCIDAVEKLKEDPAYYDNADIITGIDIVQLALEEPLRHIVRNAGVYRSPFTKFLDRILGVNEEDDILQQVLTAGGDIGYNVKTSCLEDLKEKGVIDAAKVLRVALQNGSSVAGAILTSEFLLTEMREGK